MPFVLVVLAACARPSLDPVPTIAAGEFLCEGVPREGVELLLGRSVSKDSEFGTWSEPDLVCIVSGDGVSLMTTAKPTSEVSWGGRTDEGVLEVVAQAMGAVPIAAEGVVGAGYRLPDGALWVCDGRFVRVEPRGSELVDSSRDLSIDSANLLVSMLPWGCNGADAPPATVEAG